MGYDPLEILFDALLITLFPSAHAIAQMLIWRFMSRLQRNIAP